MKNDKSHKSSSLKGWPRLSIGFLFGCFLMLFAGLTSCEQDLDTWSIFKLDVTSSLKDGEIIDAKGGTATVEIKSTGKWTLEDSNWVTADKTKGEGDATIHLKIAENISLKDRTTTLYFKRDEYHPDSMGNTIGKGYKQLTFKQKGMKDDLKFRVDISELKRDIPNRKGVYNGKIYYTIESDLSNEVIEKLYPKPWDIKVYFTYYQVDKHGIPTGTELTASCPTTEDMEISFTKGRHFVTELKDYMDHGGYYYSPHRYLTIRFYYKDGWIENSAIFK